eukprot:TRINITY_DN335_c0_g2_i2.p1 TRINITY_DN335_c0_g2~~TRINITY_DN335_c0_g2_i2.p1  ORF type:complete len:1200 (-),score=318.63 TRINITY_DN335_c0_g2_i2:208-3546(-)
MTIYPSHSDLINILGLPSNPGYRCDFQSYILPDGRIIFAFTLNGAISEQMMIDTCRIANTQITMKNKTKNMVGFVQIDPVSQAFTPQAKAYCEGLGFIMTTLTEVFATGASDKYLPLHAGETFGYLKPFPADQRLLTQKDIPVFDVLPLELSVVSGVITSIFQTVNSHVNLKSQERNTPNMILLNYPEYPCLSNFSDKPVHLTVAPYGWSAEPSTDLEVDTKYNQRLASKQWIALYHDTYMAIESYDEMCTPDDPAACLAKKKIYGTKASSLGFLRNKNVLGKKTDVGSLSESVGYDLTPIGFGIPFQFYYEFLNYPPNAYIKDIIDEMSLKEMTTEVPESDRLTYSLTLKHAFWNATVPPTILQAILDAVDKYFTPFKVNEIKLRSSSNAEDLPGFDGAGLYDSFSADVGSKTPNIAKPYVCQYDPSIDDMSPPTLECALKGIYGSLWNQRAISERTFARYRHDSCVMGIAVVPQYKELGSVTANSVCITRLIDGNTALPGYTFSIQAGDNDVTNPEPGTFSETTVSFINPNLTWTWKTTKYATPVAGQPALTTPVLNLTLMNTMMRVILTTENAYCNYKFKLPKEKCDAIALNNVKTGLDMEFKFIDNVRVHCKQLREFAGTRKANIQITANTSSPSFCGYVDPASFVPPDNSLLNNVAAGKPTFSGTVNTISTNGGSGAGVVNVPGYANKSVDNLVSVGDISITLVSTWWQVVFDIPYQLRYLRIFWCTTYSRANTVYTKPAFTLNLTRANGTTLLISVPAPTQNVYVYEFNTTEFISALRINVPSLFCAAEVQVWALPYQTGDPADFAPEARENTQPCVWDTWTEWTTCTASCAGGIQYRNRTGAWCNNYVLDHFKESQLCNTQVCPVDCVWHEWSQWTMCLPCGWSRRDRTNEGPIGTGKNCVGPYFEQLECISKGIICQTIPPLEFTIDKLSQSSLIAFISELKTRVPTLVGVEPSVVGVYYMISTANFSRTRIVVTFNGYATDGSQLAGSDQIVMAQTMSNKLITDAGLVSYLTSESIVVGNVAQSESMLGIGPGYGVTDPPTDAPTSPPTLPPVDSSLTEGTSAEDIPFWGWFLAGIALMAVIGAIIVVVVLKVKAKDNFDERV